MVSAYQVARQCLDPKNAILKSIASVISAYRHVPFLLFLLLAERIELHQGHIFTKDN